MSVDAATRIVVTLDLPADLARLTVPAPLVRRLHQLLDKQDAGETLTEDERAEAESLVDVSELLTLLKMRASRSDLASR